ncbi:hypothetical protein [Salipiger bermudensis]|uniref:hypothetical protein n=1 Tax=Salipiger bermudensis TaxID=344736 RepID=UPI001A8C707F|nr:hypothetical protein [Salipiger bermudensis]MBN9677986.1 hypothetical protein [Salipiger bermudensis]
MRAVTQLPLKSSHQTESERHFPRGATQLFRSRDGQPRAVVLLLKSVCCAITAKPHAAGALKLKPLVLIPCTDRKRIRPPETLLARNLPNGSAVEVAAEWEARLSPQCCHADHSMVYCGRAYQEAATAAKILSSELVVISAGLGLVRQGHPIPSYSLTVAPSGEDAILRKITEGQSGPGVWWRALRASRTASFGINDLLREASEVLVLISLSASYAKLIDEELSAVSEEDIGRLRIFGAGINEHLPRRLSSSVMPYDMRLNGPNSPISGTMSDFSSRALRHYADCLASGMIEGASPHDDGAVLSDIMKNWEYREIPVRTRMTDEEVVDFVLDNWSAAGGRSGVSLRLLRDSGHACEQGRFRDLFKVAKERRLEGMA